MTRETAARPPRIFARRAGGVRRMALHLPQGRQTNLAARRPGVLGSVDKGPLLRNGTVEMFGTRNVIPAQITGRTFGERPGTESQPQLTGMQA